MIELMKKTAVVCMSQDRDNCVSQLRDLGILHITDNHETESSEAYNQELKNLEKMNEVLMVLGNELTENQKEPTKGEKGTSDLSSVVAQVVKLAEDEKHCKERLNFYANCKLQMAPWGTFKRSDIERMSRNGIDVVLFATPLDLIPQLESPISVVEVSRTTTMAYMMALAPKGTEIPVEPFTFPGETDMEVIEASINELNQKNEEIHRQLLDIAQNHYNELIAERYTVQDQVNFLNACDQMGAGHDLVYLSGFVPAKDIPALQQAAEKHGWALLLTDPSDDEEVPTKLDIPKTFAFSRALFDFLGIVPNYREIDVAVPVIIFFILFSAILVGDAAYGIILLIACTYLRIKAKNETVKLGATLLNTMAVTTIIWGALNGTWFAIDSAKLPSFMQGLPWLTNPETKDANQQLVMFSIGIVHLLLGHFMYIWFHARKKWRSLIGNLGWICFLFGNYVVISNMLVFRQAIPSWIVWAYVPGLIGILINVEWTDIGGVFNLPFSLINSMVDLASYIRLFAVGMAGFYIAASVNTVSSMLTALGPVGYVLMVVLMILGHTLNIALCLMSVMVHAIRLNTLEFSNHAVISWSGIIYNPFRKVARED